MVPCQFHVIVRRCSLIYSLLFHAALILSCCFPLFCYYADIAGIITGVSKATQYHSANRAEPSTKRIIYLSDLSYVLAVVILF